MSSGKLYIVAVGASAGGLEAIHEFFDNMPSNNNTSYVIIQHLSPDYKSLLVELVSRHTQMQVFEAEDNQPVKQNCIYVIPNNKLMTIRNERLFLEEKSVAKIPNNAIDVFLNSLAKDKKEKAIAVILSGTGTDGTRGIEAIKKNKGMVIVQDPNTAKFNGMPNSAINSGNVDYVLAPSTMPEEILGYSEEKGDNLNIEHTVDDQLLERVFQRIHQVAGFDFNYYKTPTIIRRIQRRMLRGNFNDIHSYIKLLEDDVEECKLLAKDFLIGVTKFFRDKEAFDFLNESVIIPMVEDKAQDDSIKIWVCACSTGEEPYSIAILLNEAVEKQNKRIDIKIFASDLEVSNIEIASRGIYPESIEKDIAPELLQKYFTKSGKFYSVVPKVRKQIVFANHNIVKDPPFIKNDLVSCRNMLIYMNPVLQQRVFSLLLFAVKRNGYLFLGSSENPSFVKDSVTELHSKWKIYRKISESKLSMGHTLDVPERRRSETKVERKPQAETTMQGLLWDEFRGVLSRQMLFAALYIDHNYEIKEAIGNYDPILKLPKKNLRLNILRMVPQSLSAVLNSAVNKAWKTKHQVFLEQVRYEEAGQYFGTQILVKPAETIANCTLIVFTNHVKLNENAPAAMEVDAEVSNTEYVRSLENELVETKNNLQLVVEDLETVNEELQSSNEELLSANEELQSSNEELQSLNEELHTLNTEHQLKIKELLELNDDLNNYFRSTDIGQIFLTKDLKIRKFNPASARMINFIDTDLGRPITHISTNIRYSNLVADIETSIRKNDVIEREVQLTDGKNLLMRILPYVTRDYKIDGVIVSFIDITTVTNLNNIIRAVFNSSPSAIFAFQAIRDVNFVIKDFKVLALNHAATRFLNRDHASEGKLLLHDLPIIAIGGMYDRFLKVVLEDKPLFTDVFIESQNAWYEVSAVKMMDGFVVTYTDVTGKKLAEQRLKKNYVELVSVKDNLKKLNEDLENKVIERTRELSISEERFRIVSQATNDAIWDWDFVNNTVWWGDGFQKLFGYNVDRNEITRSFWVQKIHPDDRDAVQQLLNQVINKNQNQWNCEYRFEKSDGSYANILDRGFVLHDEYGTPYRMLGSMLDLTPLKSAQREIITNIEQREFLAQSMPLIVCLADQQMNFTFINKQFEVYTGLTMQQGYGQGWKAVLHPDDIDSLINRWKRNGSDRFELEIRLKHLNGDYHWNIVRANHHKTTDTEGSHWVLTFIDIHSQKLVNEMLEKKVQLRTQELREINEALEASNHDLQQFASVASHDLQEPLRKIHMFSKLINDKYGIQLNDDGQRYLEKIMQASVRMKSIITNVLNFSRLSADNNRFEAINICALITDLLEDLEVTIKERKAQIDIRCDVDIEVVPGQMRQVFQNLISNALKFSKPGVAPHVHISSENIAEKSFSSALDSNGPYCRLMVKDNGIGFDEKFKENIFALFHRLHSKDSYEGTGIGLAIVKKIVEKHEGMITAFSKQNEGATFVIVLPLKQGQEINQHVQYDQANTISR